MTVAVVQGFSPSGYAMHPLIVMTVAVVRGIGTSGYAWKGPSEMMPACRSNLTGAAVSAPSEYCAVLRSTLRTYAGRYCTLVYSGVLWGTLAVLWGTLGYSGVLWETLAVLWGTLGYSGVLWGTLGYSSRTLGYSAVLGIQPYSGVF
jgi:hypothetical protein